MNCRFVWVNAVIKLKPRQLRSRLARLFFGALNIFSTFKYSDKDKKKGCTLREPYESRSF
jgi:hypothetical protein